MIQLPVTEVTYEKMDVRDEALIYVRIQERDNGKTHKLSQEQLEGFVLYDERNIWNGFELLWNDQLYQVVFNKNYSITKKEETWFIIDVNSLGLYGVESIYSIIEESEHAKSYYPSPETLKARRESSKKLMDSLFSFTHEDEPPTT